MAKLIGKWKIESSENFDEYMKAVGEIFYFIYSYSFIYFWKNFSLYIRTLFFVWGEKIVAIINCVQLTSDSR